MGKFRTLLQSVLGRWHDPAETAREITEIAALPLKERAHALISFSLWKLSPRNEASIKVARDFLQLTTDTEEALQKAFNESLRRSDAFSKLFALRSALELAHRRHAALEELLRAYQPNEHIREVDPLHVLRAKVRSVEIEARSRMNWVSSYTHQNPPWPSGDSDAVKTFRRLEAMLDGEYTPPSVVELLRELRGFLSADEFETLKDLADNEYREPSEPL